jgi:hypothetical protein
MSRYFYATLIVSFALIFAGCQKNNDIITDERNIEGTWQITGITSDRAYDFNGDGRTETDIYGTYNSCGRDIILVFQPNGNGQIRQGCNAPWQNTSWQLNNRSLNIQLPDDDLNLQLQQFDDYTIRGTDQVQINGNNFNITYTLQRR